LEDRDQQVLMERIGGATLREIGDRHDLSHEAVRLIVVRQARAYVNAIVVSMWRAQKGGEVLAFAVPAGSADDQHAAVQYFEWLLGELRKRDDVEPRVTYRPTPDGSFAFAIEDVSFDPTGGDR
jgi:hypothetical protein